MVEEALLGECYEIYSKHNKPLSDRYTGTHTNLLFYITIL